VTPPSPLGRERLGVATKEVSPGPNQKTTLLMAAACATERGSPKR
jgi:hypothetical protein